MNTESDTAEGAEDNDTCPVKEQGLLLFQMQKKRLNEYDEGKQRAESIRVLEDIATDPAVSSDKRITFAETLREVQTFYNVIIIIFVFRLSRKSN